MPSPPSVGKHNGFGTFGRPGARLSLMIADVAGLRIMDLKRAAYFTVGWIFVALAALGVFLPLLPTTPFLLLASTCFVRSSPRAQRWLAESRWFGPILRDWNEHRAVRRPVKLLAVAVVVVVMAYSFVRDLPWALRIAIVGVGCVGLFVLWRLPTRAPDQLLEKGEQRLGTPQG